jgi:hypothetical protein
VSTTFKKRQKEMNRQEKQRLKAERRQQRRLAKSAEPPAPAELEIKGAPAESAAQEGTES